MDTPYNKPNRWSYFNKHYPELTYSYFFYCGIRGYIGIHKNIRTTYITHLGGGFVSSNHFSMKQDQTRNTLRAESSII